MKGRRERGKKRTELGINDEENKKYTQYHFYLTVSLSFPSPPSHLPFSSLNLFVFLLPVFLPLPQHIDAVRQSCKHTGRSGLKSNGLSMKISVADIDGTIMYTADFGYFCVAVIVAVLVSDAF